jgi:uncharacterized protein (TIGR00369 family)
VCGQDNPRGLRLRSRVEDGRVVLEYTTAETDLGWKQMVHGGLAMTLLDEVMTWAAILAARRACVAAELTVRLRRPIQVGQRLRVEAWTDGGRARLILTEGRIADERGGVLATAAGKYMPMSPDAASLCADDFVCSPDALSLNALLGG